MNYYYIIIISLIFIYISRNIFLCIIFVFKTRFHNISSMTNLLFFLFLSISEKLYPNSSILINDCLYHFTLKSIIKSKEWIKLSNNIFIFIAIINKTINQIFFLSLNSFTIILNIQSLIILYFMLIMNIILNLIWIFINFSSISFL